MSEQATAALSWLEAAGNPVPALLAAALLIAAAVAVGRRLTSGAAFANAGAGLLLDLAIGLTLIGWLAALLGPTAVFDRGRSLWMLLGLAALGLPGIASSRRRSSPGAAAHFDRVHIGTGMERTWFRAFWALPLLFTLGPALVLPDGWDELVYHVELPRRWLEVGLPSVDADLPYSAFPSLPELLFWLVAPVDLYLSPRLVNWVAWAVALGLLHALCRRSLGPRPSAAVTLAFALSPAVLMVSANCYVEAFLLMEVAALLWITTEDCDGSAETSWRTLLVMGVLCGGAASVKLTGLVAIGFPFLHACLGAKAPRTRCRDASIATFVAVGVCLPFYLRPLLATGNPLFPYFESWFVSDADRLQMSQFHHSVADGFGVRSVTGFLAGPILLAFNDLLYDGWFGWQLPVLLLLAAAGLAIGTRNSKPRGLQFPAMMAAALYAAWFFTAQQARFITPAALAVTVLAASGLARVSDRWRAVALALLVAASTASLPWRNAGYYFSSWETLGGYWTRTENFNDGTRGEYLPLIEAIEATPPDSRLLLLFEHRGLYLRRAREIGTPGFRASGLPQDCEANAGLFRDWLTERQATHVVLSRTPRGPDQTPEWRERVEYVYRAVELAVQQNVLQVEWQSPTHVLLKLNP